MLKVKRKFVVYEVGECLCSYGVDRYGDTCSRCNGSGRFKEEIDLLDVLKELGVLIVKDSTPLYGLDG